MLQRHLQSLNAEGFEGTSARDLGRVDIRSCVGSARISDRSVRAPSLQHSSFWSEKIMISYVRPACPKCGMHMIIVKKFEQGPVRQTFECLRCGHVTEPEVDPNINRSRRSPRRSRNANIQT